MHVKKDCTRTFCVDRWKLNSVTIIDVYPLLCIDVLLKLISGSAYFPRIDLKCPLWQVPIHPEDVEKTAFSREPGFGIYEFLNICCYLDDIIISKAGNDHLKHIREILAALEEEGLKLRTAKCFYGMTKINLMNHAIPEIGISIEKKDDRMFCIVEAQIEYKRASVLLRNMHQLPELSCDIACDHSVSTLKNAMCKLPTHIYPKDDLLIILDNDASYVDLGEIVGKAISNKSYPIIRNFIFRIENNPLSYLANFKDNPNKCVRLLALSSEFDFKIDYVRYKDIEVADALSLLAAMISFSN
ncbi:hypothetical protein RF11_01349 [Thelohanellus kitauei]|uniref:Reverse transcriptase domain-containing protein n=1 Tax=Thelohanellus kitauei TaxID=669202 RepID=A0A0C2N659_THEKT|nr:hypothetical protein RF11_01349 [Thelohanellus kitauei]